MNPITNHVCFLNLDLAPAFVFPLILSASVVVSKNTTTVKLHYIPQISNVAVSTPLTAAVLWH